MKTETTHEAMVRTLKLMVAIADRVIEKREWRGIYEKVRLVYPRWDKPAEPEIEQTSML